MLAIAADLDKIAMMDGDADRPPVTGGASVYPFCWSILLAARARGLGGVMTTFLSRAEAGAAPVLGLPRDHTLVATVFLGHPVRQITKLAGADPIAHDDRPIRRRGLRMIERTEPPAQAGEAEMLR